MSIQQSTETDLYVDWQGYHRMIERLALQIYESGWHFDVVLCLARGGLVAGNVLCALSGLVCWWSVTLARAKCWRSHSLATLASWSKASHLAGRF